ncbi:MAG: hypothetical protein D6688_00665 [Alphaproteobacteria bacterium]|nr:MAG: hypothetical protein D6688_00665 [Alphaproteobacteria bacterium]
MGVWRRAARATFSRRRWDMALAVVAAAGLALVGRARFLGVVALALAVGRILVDAAGVDRPRQGFPFWSMTVAAVVLRWTVAVILALAALVLGLGAALSDAPADQARALGPVVLVLAGLAGAAPLPLALWLLSALRRRMAEALGLARAGAPRLVHYAALGLLGIIEPALVLAGPDGGAGVARLAAGVLLAVVVETFSWALMGAAITEPPGGDPGASAQ